jgi:hypothetical protein
MVRNPLVRKFAHWCAIVTFAVSMAGALQACGSLTQSENGALGLHLGIPEGEDPALFWYGVSQKTLTVAPTDGDPTTLPWSEGQAPGVELRKGDHLTFSGKDAGGQVLVTGESTVGEEKDVTIPLHRVL